jgi:putative transposase
MFDLKGLLEKQTIHYAVKCRIYPTEEQKTFFKKQFGCCRFVYNTVLDWMNFYYGLMKKSMSIESAKKLLPFLKQSAELSFLKEVNSQSLQASVLNLGHSYSKLFAGNGGKPRFKKKVGRQCFEIPQHFLLKKSKRGNNFLLIPKIKSGIKIKVHRRVVGEVRHLHISMDPDGKYYSSLNCRKESYCVRIADSDMVWQTVGNDLGFLRLRVDDYGNEIEAPKFYRKVEQKLAREQRKNARKKFGSKNRAKSSLKVAVVHSKIKNRRKDFIHKQSNEIVDKNQVIYFETLNLKGMMQNRCLAKSVADAMHGEFIRQCKYKAVWRGKHVVQIGRFEPSSKLCSNCQSKNNDLKLHHRIWKCKVCGVLHDRDINAAKNIKRIGQEMSEFTPVERSTAGCYLVRWQPSWLNMKEAGSGS